MTKIKSNYLERELEVNASQSVNSLGDSKTIISHDSLEKIIYTDSDTKNLGTIAEYTIASADAMHSVVLCTIKDSAGRHIQAIGESVPATLTTDLARQIPTLIASQRAFDRAAIRYLGLPGKVYSNVEVNECVIDGCLNGQFVDGETKIKPESLNTVKEKEPETVKNENVNSPQKEANFMSEEIKSAGATVITIGKYQGKNKTIAEVYDKDYDWLSYIVNNVTPRKDDLKIQLELAKLYFNKMNEARAETTK